MRYRTTVIGLVSLAGALLADQFFKLAVQTRLNQMTTETFVGPLRLGYYPNAGIGFGIQLPIWLIAGTVGLVVIGLAAWLLRAHHRIAPMVSWGVGLILIGAISNLFDRMMYGHVIDVFNFNDWSVFNIADVWIIVGVFVIVVGISSKRNATPSPKRMPSQDLPNN
ncbi:MAG: signal peptidase II [Patescibacteria group bacterium]|jgi:signal peptidase II